MTTPDSPLVLESDLGMDANLAEVSLLVCPLCSRRWLRYFYEMEAFTGSGRWYLGTITVKQAKQFTTEDAKTILENLDWYYYGGSYYMAQTGKTRGKILLNP